MKCINRKEINWNKLALLATLLCGSACGPACPALAAADYSLGQAGDSSPCPIVRSGQQYKEQLRNYRQEVQSLAKQAPPGLDAPTKNFSGREEARQMPPLPTKSVRYNQLVGDSTLGEISIFQDNSLIVKNPKLSALISIDNNLNPFSMDAKYSQAVTLRELLRLGVWNNLDIRVARNNAKAAKFDYLSSLGQFLPDIDLGDQQYWFKGNITVPINNRPTSINLSGPFMISHAGFTYHVYQGGKVLFGALQRRHLLNASNAQVHTSYSDALADIARRYYQLALQESILQIRVRAADTSEEQVRVSTKRFEQGLGTNLDVLQARQQLAADRQSLLDQQVMRRQAAIDLAALLNYDLNVDLKPMVNVNRAILVQRPGVESLLQVAFKNRPELKDLIEQKKAASSQIALAGSALQPTVDFVGNVYGIGPDSGGLNKVDALYFLGLNMNWKLGGLGTIDAANIQAARARANNANVELRKKAVEITQSVRNAYIKSLSTAQNIVEADNRVAAAVEELRLAEIRYQTGVGTHLDVLTGQRDYTQAQITKAQAITDFNVAQVQLVRELGLISVDNLSSSKPIL